MNNVIENVFSIRLQKIHFFGEKTTRNYLFRSTFIETPCASIRIWIFE